MPEMVAVSSSNVESVGYDDGANELFVRYLTGRTYKYLDVEKEVYDELLEAPSVGVYLNQVVKPTYSYEEV